MSEKASVTCCWCGCPDCADQLSCPACGAPCDVASAPTTGTWTKLPPIRDMARIRFGQSTCQIQGDVTPVADIRLAAGDQVYFVHHALLWREPAVATSLLTLRDGWMRMLCGMPVYLMQAVGPGRIAFSGMNAGDLIAVPIPPGQSIDVLEHRLLVANDAVRYDFFDTHFWYATPGDKTDEIHYPLGQFMDRFTATDRPGVVLLHTHGDVFLRDLADGEELLVQASSLIYKSPTVAVGLHIEQTRQRVWGIIGVVHRFALVRLTGPGRVAVQSVFKHPEEVGRILRHS